MVKSKTIRQQRIAIVYGMLLQGISRSGIIQYAVNSEGWDVTTRTIDNYISKAYVEIEKEVNANISGQFGKALTRLNNLYAKAIKKEDLYLALNIQKEINMLFDLYEYRPESETPATQGFEIGYTENEVIEFDEAEFTEVEE